MLCEACSVGRSIWQFKLTVSMVYKRVQVLPEHFTEAVLCSCNIYLGLTNENDRNNSFIVYQFQCLFVSDEIYKFMSLWCHIIGIHLQLV